MRHRRRRPARRAPQGWRVKIVATDGDPHVLIDGKRVSSTKARGLADTLSLMAEAMDNPGDVDKAAQLSASKRLARHGVNIPARSLAELEPRIVSELAHSLDCRERTKKALANLITAASAEKDALQGTAHPDWQDTFAMMLETLQVMDEALAPPGMIAVPDTEEGMTATINEALAEASRQGALPKELEGIVKACAEGSDEALEEALLSDEFTHHMEKHPIFGVDSGSTFIKPGQVAHISVAPAKALVIESIVMSAQMLERIKSLEFEVADKTYVVPLHQFHGRGERKVFSPIGGIKVGAKEELCTVVTVTEEMRVTFSCKCARDTAPSA